MKKRLSLTAFILIVLFSSSALAADKWEIDSAHSGIMFEVKHIFSAIRGYFSDFEADIRFDKNDLENSMFNFTVKTDSINTGIGKRDNHLRSGDFFDTGKYPEMEFKSTEIKHVKEGEYILEGNMRVKDVTKKVSFKAEFLGSREHPLQKGTMVAGFETAFQIDRLNYNVGSGKFYELGVVGDKVDVLISFETTKQ